MNQPQIEARLLGAFYHTSGAFPIHPGCDQMMRDLIRDGAASMVQSGNHAPDEVEKAVDSVTAFVLEMKEESRSLGRDDIGEFTFGPVMSRLQSGQRQGWWPFSSKA